MSSLDTLIRRVESTGGLPVFPGPLTQAIALIGDDAPLSKVAKVLEHDPGLASRLLRLANSAYYGVSREVTTVSMALVLLGVRRVRNLILGVGVGEVLGAAGIGSAGYPAPDLAAHSHHVGWLTARLGLQHGQDRQDELFLAGLVHDVGQLVLCKAFPAETAEHAEKLQSKYGEALLDAELRVFQIAHPQAGSWAARHWRLPDEIVDAIERHHETPATDTGAGLAELVRLGNLLARPTDDAILETEPLLAGLCREDIDKWNSAYEESSRAAPGGNR